ncbi:MAG: Fic family protein [Alphaproteobacteria bacterium]|nr:Fic family protein [Alphaproteobacteria bacterium]
MLPHWRWTWIADRHVYRELVVGGVEHHVLPPPRAPEQEDLPQLLFAMRHDGVSLPIVRALLKVMDLDLLAQSIEAEVRSTPTGAYIRRIWFLFEELTGRTLKLPDMGRANYVPLLDPLVHVTGRPRKVRRQRIDLNTLGGLAFSPTVRRTPAVQAISGDELQELIRGVVLGYDAETLQRAISYLYTRETLASFEIERERPPHDRAERFVSLLRRADREATVDEALLVELQGALLDPRFVDETWRTTQVYVGESISFIRQRVHFAAPKPGDVPELMQAWITSANDWIQDVGVEPVIAAAALSFGFVLIHPFNDGNGRTHRWLIHWALARQGVTPSGMVIPVSAVMLSRRAEYDQVLETFSTPLMPLVEYSVDEEGVMEVLNDTMDLYRHPDLTAMTEGLWRWLVEAVEESLAEELEFLLGLDRARERMQSIVDLPDRLLHLFIKLVRQNRGSLSKTKRERSFSMLNDEEVEALERAVNEAFAARR